MNGGQKQISDLSRLASRHRTAISATLGILFVVLARPHWLLMASGIPLIVLGEGIRIWASGYIHKNDRITQEGPYSITRNPLYIGNFFVGLGFVIAAGVRWFLPAFLLFFGLLYFFTIRYEERFLSARFPDAYASYVRSVPRIIGVRSFAGYRKGQFRWEQVARHREINNILVILIVLLLFSAKAYFRG